MKESRSFIEDKFREGKRSFIHLSHEEQLYLTGILIQEQHPAYRGEFVTETDFFDDALIQLSLYFKANYEGNCESISTHKSGIIFNITMSALSFSARAAKELFESMEENYVYEPNED